MLKIQFNIQTQPLSDPDREDESKKSNKNKTPLKVQELTDHTVIDMIDDDPNIESNCTANESTDDAQTILVDSTSDGTPNIISECASSEPVVDQEDDDDDDLLTIVDDMEYLVYINCLISILVNFDIKYKYFFFARKNLLTLKRKNLKSKSPQPMFLR